MVYEKRQQLTYPLKTVDLEAPTIVGFRFIKTWMLLPARLEVKLPMEVTPGFEPGHRGFADLCLTAWLCHHIKKETQGLFNFGADDGARTRYLHLGKVALYQMSYIRKYGASDWNRTSDIRIFSPPLYRLSYRSKWRPGTGSNRRPLA